MAHIESNVSVSFPAILLASESGLSYLYGPNCSGYNARVSGVPAVYAKSEKQARAKLKAQLNEHIGQAFEHFEHRYDRVVLGTKNGEVLVVEFSYGWLYRIYGPDRKRSSTVGNFKDLNEAVAAARNHAEQSYGGIVWENRF